MDKSGLQPFYPKPLDVIMEEYHPGNNAGGFVADNFNVEIHGNSVDTHYHHGPSAYSPYRNYEDSSYHYSKTNHLDLGTTSYKNHHLDTATTSYKNNNNNHYSEGHNIEFYSRVAPNTETDFRAHVDYNQIVVADELGRNTISPEAFQELMEETKKEIEAAGTAVDNLGYNYSQDVKTVFHDLSTRLNDAHTRWLADMTNGGNNAAVKDEIINNLTDMLNKEKEKTEAQRTLGEQQVEELHNKQEEFNLKLADKFHDRKVKQYVVNALRSNMMASWKKRCEDTSKKKTEDVCRQLKGKYTAAQDKLDEEIAKLKREQVKLAQEKAEYESAVQQGLMKGLCSLNMEALRVFKLKIDPSGTDITWQTPSEESNQVEYDASQPHITRADSENPLGLTPSLVVIMENTKDKQDRGSAAIHTPSELEAFVNRSAGQPRPIRTPKKNDSEHQDVTNKKSKNLKLPPNYQVIKLLKKANAATNTKKK